MEKWEFLEFSTAAEVPLFRPDRNTPSIYTQPSEYIINIIWKIVYTVVLMSIFYVYCINIYYMQGAVDVAELSRANYEDWGSCLYVNMIISIYDWSVCACSKLRNFNVYFRVCSLSGYYVEFPFEWLGLYVLKTFAVFIVLSYNV